MEDEDFSALPLEEKLSHKSWKARQQAYEELRKKFRDADSPKDLIFREFFDYIKSLPLESNVVAQENAISTMITFFDCCDVNLAKKLRPDITTISIEKGLCAVRAGTRTKTLELLMILIETDGPDPVITDLLSFLPHKHPKLVAASINALTEIIKGFGTSVVGIKGIMSSIPAIFQHADKNVRAEGTAMVVEIHRWINGSVFTFLNGLKPIQLKEVQELCSLQMDQNPVPTRFLKGQKPNATQNSSNSDETIIPVPLDTLPSEASKLDPFDLAEPVMVLDSLPSDFYDKVSSPSWKERKETLEALLKVLSVPRIIEDRYSELVDALIKRIADVNVLVVVEAAHCIEKLGNGLRNDISPYRSQIIASLLERSKEKKQNVLDALRGSLDSLSYSIKSFPLILEESAPFLIHKNPSVRTETLLWLFRLLKSLTSFPQKKDAKVIVEAVIPSMDDSVTDVRDACATLLALIYRALGDKIVSPWLEKLDKIKMTKIVELSLKINLATSPLEVTTLIQKPVKPVPLTPGSQPPPDKVPKTLEPPPKPQKSVPQPQLNHNPISKVGDSRPFSASCSVSDEDAESYFTSLVGDEIIDLISDAQWKTRLQATTDFSERLFDSFPAELNTEALAKFLAKRPGWKDSNFQVLGKVIGCLQRVSSLTIYSKESVAVIIPGLLEKLSDPKLRQDCSELFLTLAEHVSLQSILDQLYGPTKSQKSPKIQADIVKWIQGAVLQFGLAGINIQLVVDLCKFLMNNANAAVRGSAVTLAGLLRIFLGPDTQRLFSDLSPPPLINVLEAEFTRVATEPRPIPTRFMKPVGSTAGSSKVANQVQDSNDSEVANIDDMIPRADITSSVTPQIISKCCDANWKIRKEGLDEIQEILTGAKNRVKYSGFDLFAALKSRLADSNKNLVSQTLELMGNLAEAIGPLFEKNLKLILPGVINTLSDNKLQIRQQALRTLDKFYSVCPYSSFVSISSSALAGDSPNIRRELMTWLCSILSSPRGSVNKDDVLEAVVSVASCLQDRSQDVRKSAQSLFGVFLDYISPELIKKTVSSQQPKLLASVVAALDLYKNRVNVLPNAPTPNLQNHPKTPQRSISNRSAVGGNSSPSSGKAHQFSNQAEKDSHGDDPLILSSDPTQKVIRSERDKLIQKWSFEFPRKDIVDFLREQMIGNISYTMILKLFSEDSKDQIFAMSRFEEYIQNAKAEGVEDAISSNSDLLLKYLTTRFFDTNAAILIKSLDLVEKIVSFMDSINYRLTEYEASCFLPFLIGKLGDTKEQLRMKIHYIFRQLCRIYPASKLFLFFIDGLKNKNSKTRARTLEELGTMLSRNGLSVINSGKHVPVIGGLISDKDPIVRNVALNILSLINSLIGPNTVHKFLTGLSQKEIDLLDERLKRTEPVTWGKFDDSSSEEEDGGEFNNDNGMEDIDNNGINCPTSTPVALKVDELYLPSLPTPMLPFIRRTVETTSTTNPIEVIVEEIFYSADSVCINSLQKLEICLNSDNSTNVDLYQNADQIVHALVVRMKEATSAIEKDEISQTKSRLSRYILNSLILMITNPGISVVVSRETIELLISETINGLVNEKILLFEDHEQIIRALNILLVKILELIPPNKNYSSLLSILCLSFRVPPSSGQKYPELVMKCLWKLTKQLASQISTGSVNIQELFRDIHLLFSVLPPMEWKMRSNEKLPFEDLPLRTVKTILHESVQTLGLEVLKNLDLISVPEESFVTSYLKAMLIAKGFSETDIEACVDPRSMDICDYEACASNFLTDEEIENTLKSLCSQICSKPDTRLGLQELYNFRKANPYAADRINSFLLGLGDFFYKYIVRSLDRIESENSKLGPSASLTVEAPVDVYKSKLNQLRLQIFGNENSDNQSFLNQSPAKNLGNISDPTDIRTSRSMTPIQANRENFSHFQKPPPPPPISPSSILSLKERLAKLRGESQQPME